MSESTLLFCLHTLSTQEHLSVSSIHSFFARKNFDFTRTRFCTWEAMRSAVYIRVAYVSVPFVRYMSAVYVRVR